MPFYCLRGIKLVMHQYLGGIITLHVGKGTIIMCPSYCATSQNCVLNSLSKMG